MSHELTVRFDREFIRNGLKRDYVWRAIYRVGLIVVLGLVAVLALRRGGYDAAWVPLPFVGLVLVTAARFAIGFRTMVDRTLQLWLKQSPDGTILFRADHEAITIDLEESHTRYNWGDLRRLWRYDDVWLIEVVKNTSVLFPPQDAPEEMKRFIVERCRNAGVRV